jgi:hypothetical protein
VETTNAGAAATNVDPDEGPSRGVDDTSSTPGASSANAVTTAYLVCNDHKDCTRKVRISSNRSGVFCLYTMGEHTTEQTKGKRKNSTLSWEMDQQLSEGGHGVGHRAFGTPLGTPLSIRKAHERKRCDAEGKVQRHHRR